MSICALGKEINIEVVRNCMVACEVTLESVVKVRMQFYTQKLVDLVREVKVHSFTVF